VLHGAQLARLRVVAVLQPERVGELHPGVRAHVRAVGPQRAARVVAFNLGMWAVRYRCGQTEPMSPARLRSSG
jgi:hypothetical protein